MSFLKSLGRSLGSGVRWIGRQVKHAEKKGRGEAFFFLKSVSLTNSALFRF